MCFVKSLKMSTSIEFGSRAFESETAKVFGSRLGASDCPARPVPGARARPGPGGRGPASAAALWRHHQCSAGNLQLHPTGPGQTLILLGPGTLHRRPGPAARRRGGGGLPRPLSQPEWYDQRHESRIGREPFSASEFMLLVTQW
jgi:hypothetical protein